MKTKSTAKFIIMSIIGIIYFFIPVVPNGDSKDSLLIWSVNFFKGLLASSLSYIVLLAILLLIIFCLLGRSDKFPVFKKYYGNVKTYSIVLYILGFIFACMTVFQIGPESLINGDVGGQGIGLSKTVIVTIIVAGIMVPFLAEFGFLEFIGGLINPLMRPLFKLPGYSAIDAVTSFVANPTLGIYLTNKIYNNKQYTTREAASIATNFSFISLGFFAVLTATANITQYYGSVILWSFILSFVMAAIVIRIWPLRSMPDTYIDGSVPTPEERKKTGNIFVNGYNEAIAKAEKTPFWPTIWRTFKEVLIFAQKIAAYIMIISTVTFFLVENTPIFEWLGIPFVPILNLLQVPDASAIAPAMVLGLAEIAIPATYISGFAVSEAAAFFVVTVSALQIIMFSNSAVSIMESDIPLSIWKLIAIFIIRTIIAMPLVAIVMHIIF